ncbi:MAG: GNAT family N-acetyltransferase [Candidatus Heimdallarchaeota archaeon]|nr:GNAT family N-acetyltransferase [Candidatus Heimdallarchaeota archaeon]
MTLHEDYIIEQFTLTDSDMEYLPELLTHAFLEDEAAQEEGATIILSEENFRLIFGSPTIDREIFVRARYKPTNEIVGFLGSLHKALSMDDNEYKVSWPVWLSVHKNHRRKGIATAMGKKMLQVVKKAGYDAGVAFHEFSQHGLEASKAIARETNLPMIPLKIMNKYIVRAYDVKEAVKVVKVKWYERLYFRLKQKIGKVQSSRVRLYHPDDLDQIFELCKDLSNRTQVAIIHEYEDLKWKLNKPQVLCVVHEDEQGKIDGFLVAWEFLLAGFGHSVEFGWLDTIHSYNLPQEEAVSLANFFGKEALKLGWKGIQTPFIPYFDPKPFKKANFIFFPKKIGLYLFNITGIPVPDKIDSIYFEWR